jgi:hypothetical protein
MNTRTRRASTPAYYLGRPAALWLAALTPRPADRTTDRTSPHVSRARKESGSSPAQA